MSTILIADDNPDILTLVGETLRAAGHQVVQTVNPSRVTSLLDTSTVDAAVLDVVMPISGLDLLKEIRAQPRWKNLPVLLLSGLGDTQDRVRGIREGADDYLAKPFEPAELVARVERLIARRDSEPGLSGNLEDFAPGDVTQNLAQGGKSGCLRVSSDNRLVEAYFVRGKIVSVEAGSLSGDEALLSLLTLDQGHFVFEASSEDEAREHASGDPLELNSILLEAAWLEDELKRRRPTLAQDDLVLRVVGPKPADLDEDFESLPVNEIYSHIVSHPGIGAQELVELEVTSPSRILLTVAILLEHGSLDGRERDPSAPSRRRLRQDPLGELLAACQDRGLSKTIYLLILFQQQAWKELLGLVKSIPTELLAGERQQLLDELIMRGSGTVRLAHEEGVVVLNLKPLRGDRLQGEALLSLAAGVVLWLAGDVPDSLDQYIEKLEDTQGRSQGVLLTSDLECGDRLRALVKGRKHWKVSTNPVKNVSALVDLLIDPT